MTTLSLIADFGGTNARFALCGRDGVATHPQVLLCADYAGPAEAAENYLARAMPHVRPTQAAFAVASPLTGDQVKLTNHDWEFSIDSLQDRLEMDDLKVVNDFTANALGIAHLNHEDVVKIGGGKAREGSPKAIIGPGTGLGVAMLIPCADCGWIPVATEGGHVTTPASNDEEWAIINSLREKFGHVSAERMISGQGLTNLYEVIAGEIIEPREVTSRAMSGDESGVKVLDIFFALLGTVAGNLALGTGAMGGIYLSGGILPRLTDALTVSRFRERFEAKGRFEGYNSDIPTYVVTHPFPAFLGLAGLVSHGKT